MALRISALGAWLFASPVVADTYFGVGTGVVHSRGGAFQLATAITRNVALHYSTWKDGESDHAVGIGYRFWSEQPISVMFGIAYVGTVTENLLRHEDAYIEVRIRLCGRFSCQVSHYSTVGDDKGENLLLCGFHWE